MRIFNLFLFTLTLAVTACNTIEGLGQDVESTGEAIEGSANDAKQ